MTKSSKNWWARFLFQDKGILPSRRFILILILIAIFLFVLSFLGIHLQFVITVIAIIFLASLADLFFTPKRKDIHIERIMNVDLERGLNYTVKINIQNHSDFPFSFQLVDGLPQSFRRPFPLNGLVERRSTGEFSYETVADVRGKYEITNLYFRYQSVLGLWTKQTLVHLPMTIRVIPDLTETKKLLEDAQLFLLYEGERIKKHYSGMGEFAQIRSYVVGDDPRKINWRQTAKLQELMTNEYEPEHGKYITILIDCGRMMGVELSKGNRLERTLEAAMTVAAAALKKGDYVSVLAFSKDIKVFVPHAKGMEHLQTILTAIYDLQVDPVEPNYGRVFSYLDTMQKKRSFLLLFSDVRTFLHEENTLFYLQRLRRKHLFFMIGIEDHILTETINKPIHTVEDAMIKSIAQQETLFKIREKTKWEKLGLIMIEAKAENLAIAAVSHYIDTMNRHQL